MVRSASTIRLGRRRHLRSVARETEHQAHETERRAHETERQAREVAILVPSRTEASGLAPGRTRRHGGSSQDRALYACSCGYAFNAAVSTSVGCPHCGRTQAW